MRASRTRPRNPAIRVWRIISRMVRRALIILLASALAACNRGCSTSAPHKSSEVQPVTVVGFDEVTEKVWDVVADGQSGIAVPVHVDKEFIRKMHRRAIEKCLNPERENAIHLLGTEAYRLSSIIDIGPGDRFEMHLGGHYDNRPLPRLFVELRTKIEKCIESEYRASGIYQQTGGGTVHISLTACNLSGSGE
jgi:hypothetical protein